MFPDEVVEAIDAGMSLSEVVKAFDGKMGDYSLARSWHHRLSKEFNWVGATMLLNYVQNYQEKARAGSKRHRQVMFEQAGVPVGYARYLHLLQDTPTRRHDCTKIEETLISSPRFLGDISLFRAMYEHVLQDAAEQNHARVITELGVGLPPQRFNSFARQIKSLTRRDDLTPEDNTALQRARRMFETDWLDVTARFIEDIGFGMTDVIVPEDPTGEATAQIRISRAVDGKTPLELPAYSAKNRHCESYTGRETLDAVQDYLDLIKRRAIERYGLTPAQLCRR